MAVRGVQGRVADFRNMKAELHRRDGTCMWIEVPDPPPPYWHEAIPSDNLSNYSYSPDSELKLKKTPIRQFARLVLFLGSSEQRVLYIELI